MNWEQLEKVNKEIKTTELKGKEYAEVKERVIAYRKLYTDGVIHTELKFTDNYVLAEATATDNEGKVLSVGHAREMLNRAFAVENCETSAVGRCLGFIGIGINTAIASKEDIENTESPSGVFDELIITPAMIKTYADEFRELFSKEKQAQILNGYGVLKAEDMDFNMLQAYVNKKKNEKQTDKGERNQPTN